ncbi:MAG: GIY-YIG nuclease family protein, partial [Ignavibacteriaceae bacterium]|nr:GIY-YIG nuclease family protein [Ignavibacteriaceae bacterium]
VYNLFRPDSYMYYVYILRSEKDKKRYIGMTSDIERRLLEQHSGSVISTKHRRPLALIYHEKFDTKTEAMRREEYFKTGSGRKWLRENNY